METAQVPLYDANCDQRIPFLIETNDRRFEVAYILGPQTDDVLIDYDKLRDHRQVRAEQSETGQRDAVEATDNEFGASLWLFNDRLQDVEGFGDPGETKPDDWRDLIGDDQDKVAVVDGAYLAASVVPAPVAKPGDVLPWRRERAKEVVRVKAIFSGYELELTHEPQVEISAEMLADYNGIMRSRWLVQGTRVGTPEVRATAKAARLGNLYDQLRCKITGYAESGKVPLHHKGIVAMHVFGKAGEAVRKNSNSSPTQ